MQMNREIINGNVIAQEESEVVEYLQSELL